MTEANRDNWKVEGEKDDRRIDDLLAVCMVEDAAGLAVDEIFEATPFDFFEDLIIGRLNASTCWKRAQRGHRFAPVHSWFPHTIVTETFFLIMSSVKLQS